MHAYLRLEQRREKASRGIPLVCLNIIQRFFERNTLMLRMDTSRLVSGMNFRGIFSHTIHGDGLKTQQVQRTQIILVLHSDAPKHIARIHQPRLSSVYGLSLLSLVGTRKNGSQRIPGGNLNRERKGMRISKLLHERFNTRHTEFSPITKARYTLYCIPLGMSAP